VSKKRHYLLLADEDLISLTDGGDAQAFAALYDRHGRVAYSLAYRMMGERQAAEDLVQESFLKMWRAAGATESRGQACAPGYSPSFATAA
jgi:RNA polymerase sigma-70 factor (ECF subfamily)